MTLQWKREKGSSPVNQCEMPLRSWITHVSHEIVKRNAALMTTSFWTIFFKENKSLKSMAPCITPSRLPLSVCNNFLLIDNAKCSASKLQTPPLGVWNESFHSFATTQISLIWPYVREQHSAVCELLFAGRILKTSPHAVRGTKNQLAAVQLHSEINTREYSSSDCLNDLLKKAAMIRESKTRHSQTNITILDLENFHNLTR